MEKILITGGSGFVGKHLVKGLREKNLVEFNLSGGKDVTRKQDFDDLPFDITTIIHLAAITNVPLSWEKPEEVLNVNLLGTLNVLEFAKKVNANVIFASSYLYGVPKQLPIDEEQPLSAENPYGLSKLSAEELCRMYSKKYNIPVTALRFFNIYGPGQSDKMVISQMISELKLKGKITIMDGSPKRDFVFVSDVVAAYIKAMENQKDGFEIYNIGSGESFSIREVAEKLLEVAQIDGEVIDKGEKRPNDIPETQANIIKARQQLNWSPQVSLSEGLQITLQKT